MTHLIDDKIPETGWYLIKKKIQKDDRVIFQWKQDDEKDMEQAVNVSHAITGEGGEHKGIMKGYTLFGWLPLP